MSDDPYKPEQPRWTGQWPRDSDLSPEQLRKLRYNLNRSEVILGLLGALVFGMIWLFTRQ